MKRLSSSIFLCLLSSVFFLSCETDNYEKGEGRYSLLLADFAYLTVNSEKVGVSFLTDEGENFLISNPQKASWIQTADTIYRAYLYYNKIENGKARVTSMGSLPTLKPRDAKEFKRQPQDPLGLESSWLTRDGKYINLGLLLKNGRDDNGKEGEGFVSKVFHRFGTWRNRLVNRSTRPEDPKEYSVHDNFQVAHANFAIASSGVIGKGPGNSVERDYLPQAFSDFIFSIIIEEMGLIGAIVVVFLYIILLFRAARISSRCENNFPAFLVMGLALLLVSQAAINMMVATDFGIVTGQPLPLVSKGGTSTLVSCAYIGAILSVSRSARRNDAHTQPVGVETD